MKNKEIGVDFEIMEDTDTEVYLGDVTGNNVTDEARWEEPLKKLRKKGEDWNRENIGIHGRAIVANTILTAGLTHRSAVNALSPSLRKKIQEEFRAFMWKGGEKRARTKWEVLVQEEKEGGVGLRDPLCMLDAAKIRMIVSLLTKDRQPWMRWIERKLRRVGERWNMEASALEATPDKQQQRELKEGCLVESTLKIWFEIGGCSRERLEGGGEEKESKEEEIQNKKKTRTDKKRTKKEIGVEIEGKWIPITRLTTTQAYNQLKAKRLRARKYKPKKAHENIDSIQDKLTADERDYWWRLTHELISTKNKESKWKREESGELIASTCPVCKTEKEDASHYNNDCSLIQVFRKRVAKRGRRGGDITKEEWNLEAEGMEENMMVLIAKARWVYHCERCKMDRKKRRRLNMETLMNRLDRRMAIIEKG